MDRPIKIVFQTRSLNQFIAQNYNTQIVIFQAQQAHDKYFNNTLGK
jgi:hypothetical protein